MSTVRRTLDLDTDTNARLEILVAERGQDAAGVVADAIAMLISTIEIEGPDVEEDLRRLRKFEHTGIGVPGEEVMTWVSSWGTDNELPTPKPRKLK
jgi:predicted transcriptional regulator